MRYLVMDNGGIKSYVISQIDGKHHVDYHAINPPKRIDTFNGAFAEYLSNSVAYVGDYKGLIYYADPAEGSIIWTIDLWKLNILNGWGDYRILWGNTNGYLYIYTHNYSNGFDIIYYLFRDEKILGKWQYNLSGYLETAYYWNGGLILKFHTNSDSWLHIKSAYYIYYMKNGTIYWHLTLLSEKDCNGRDSNIYIHDNYIYYFWGENITIYRENLKIKSLQMPGEIASIYVLNNRIYIVLYKGLENMLYVLDKNFTMIKTIPLFDLGNIGIKRYNLTNQKVNIYENETGYTIYMYTVNTVTPAAPYLPLRIVRLNKDLNVIFRKSVNVYIANDIYPYTDIGSFILVRWSYELYIVHPKVVWIFNSYLFFPVLGVGMMVIAYSYAKYKEWEIIKKKYQNSYH